MDVIYSLDGAKTSEFVKFHEASLENDFETICEMIATYAESCPKHWGAVNEAETYLDGEYKTVTLPAFQGLLTAEKRIVGVNVEFDMRKVTGRAMSKITKVKASDVRGQAEILSSGVVVSVGGLAKDFDVSNINDYLDLPILDFRWLWKQFVNELNSKN